MFDIGFWELAILFGLGLAVLGPEKLPKVASQVGNWAGQARRMARNLSAQMQAEINLEDVINPPSSTSKDPEEVKPAWQTSAGLRPGYSSEAEAASEEEAAADDIPEEVGHREYDPAEDPKHELDKEPSTKADDQGGS